MENLNWKLIITLIVFVFLLVAMFVLRADPTCTEAIRLRDTETTRERFDRWIGTTDEEWRRRCFEVPK